MANIDGKPASDVFKNIFAPKTPTKDAAPPAEEEQKGFGKNMFAVKTPSKETAPEAQKEEKEFGRNMFPQTKLAAEKDDLIAEIEHRLQEKEADKSANANQPDGFGDLFSQTDASKTSAAQAFKDVFPPQDTLNVTPKTPTAESFKDVFKQTPPVTPKAPAAETPPEKNPATPQPEEDTKKVPLADVMKEAKEKGTIDKETYDAAIQKIVKSNIEGNTLVGGFKVVQRGSKSEIVLDEGSIEIPAGSKVEVIKRGGEISIIVKKGEGGVIFEGGADSIEKLTEDDSEKNKKTASKTSLGQNQSWLEGYEDDAGGAAASELKDELDLTDLRKEFRQKKKKEAEAEEEAKAEAGEEEEAEPSLFDRLFKRIKKTTEENPQEKLKRLSLENLSRVKGMGDERKALVGVAYVLKEFLEVKYEIPHELTYTDLIREIRARQMNNETRNKLITFFKNTTLMVYANGPKADSFQRAYGMAERAIKELS